MPSPDSRSTMASLRNSSVSPSSAWNQFAPGTPERSNTTGSSATTIPSVSCVSATAIPALLEHGADLGDTMAALLHTCSISGEIYGTPSPELMKALEGFDVRIYSPYQSI